MVIIINQIAMKLKTNSNIDREIMILYLIVSMINNSKVLNDSTNDYIFFNIIKRFLYFCLNYS